jgi:hypothetical protein
MTMRRGYKEFKRLIRLKNSILNKTSKTITARNTITKFSIVILSFLNILTSRNVGIARQTLEKTPV